MNRTGRRVVAAMAVALLGAPVGAAAQGRVNVDVVSYAAVPTGALGERWGLSLGFGANAAFDLVPNYAVYGGYSRTFIDLDFIDDVKAVDSGFAAGLTRRFPIAGPDVVPWVATGLLVHDLEVDGARGGGGSKPGFELRAGLRSRPRFIPRLRASLELGYRQYGSLLLTAERETVSYVTAGAGLNYSF